MKLLQHIQEKKTKKHNTTRNKPNRDIQTILKGIIPRKTEQNEILQHQRLAPQHELGNTRTD